MDVDLILWDWNGTLIDDSSLCVSILNEILSEYGKNSVDVCFYRKNFCFPVSAFYRLISLPYDGVEFNTVSATFISKYRKYWKKAMLQPGASFVLQTIHQHGIEQSILSAGKQEDVDRFILHHNLAKYFTSVHGTNNIRAEGKLNVGLEVVRKYECKPSKILLVGDTLHDLEIGNTIGCRTLLYTKGHNHSSVFKSSNGETIDKLEDILNLVIH